MNVRIDSNGYAYNADSGNYLTIWYDGDGNAYDADTGEAIDSIEFDSGGTTYRGAPGWNQTLQTIATGALVPRGQYSYGQYPGGGINAGGSLNRGGIQTGFNVSTNTLMLIAGGVLIFLFAKGRR